MKMRIVSAFLASAAMIIWTAAPAQAGILSKSTAKITQLRIVHNGPSTSTGEIAGAQARPGGAGLAGKTHPGMETAGQPGVWGVYSDYIGPGDINRLLGVELFLDTYNRIAAVKVSRESYNGDIVTSIFTGIVEFSIQTLQPGSNRPSKDTQIIIRTGDGLTIP